MTYDIQVTGLAAVEAAMGKVEGMLARVNAATGYTRNGRERTSGTYAATLNKTAASGAQLQRQADKAAKDAERRAAQEARAATQSAKAVERAEKQKTKAVEQEAAKRERIRSQEAKDQARASANQERQAKRAEQAQSAAAQRTGTSRYNRLAGIAGNAWGTVRNAGVMALGAAGLGGGALFATAVHSQMSAMAAASKLANQFSENGATVDSIRATKHSLLKEAGGVRGYTSEEALGAMSKYHEKTGEAGSARRMVKKLGDLSLASGANIEDVSEFGSIIHNVLKTKGIGTAEAEPMVYDLLKNAAAVAKEKSIELRDFARVGGSVIAQAPLLTGDVASNAKLGMSITQMAIAGGATSPEEAATSYQNMIADMVKHQKQLKGMGIKDSIKGGKLDLAGTLGQVLEKTNGDIDKAMKVFNIRGLRAFTGLGVAYKTAEESQKGSGRSAVMGELARLSGATLTEDTIKAGVTSRMEDPDMQWKEAQKALSREIGSQLLPVVTALIPRIAELAPMFGKLASGMASVVEWFAKNPLTGITSLIAGLVIKDVAGAAIGESIKRVLTSALAGGGAGGAGGGLGGGAGTAARSTSALGVLAAAGAGLGLGLPIAAALYEGGTNATLDARKRAKDSSKAFSGLIAAGGDFDKPFEIAPGMPIDPNHPAALARKAQADQMGLKRRQKVLNDIMAERLGLDQADRDGKSSLLGVAGAGFGLALSSMMPWQSAKQGQETAASFDMTGAGAREEQRKILADRERRALAGDYDRAQPDLEKQGYSTEDNDQGRGAVKLDGAGDKLASAADALNDAARAIADAAANGGGGGNYQRPAK